MTDARGHTPESGPGRPGARGDRREQTRAALLAAAERLWAERGIHGASLDDIAAAAGLTKGAVYSNFAGKTDLLLALMERITSARTRTDVCDELRAAAEDADRTGRPSRRDSDEAPAAWPCSWSSSGSTACATTPPAGASPTGTPNAAPSWPRSSSPPTAPHPTGSLPTTAPP